ncbi:hypothetical protein IH992_16375, partial [Candidatus Poribacteria bacterium]|nr:hypothetical protein [Candidatus Poribacteria bacterium]
EPVEYPAVEGRGIADVRRLARVMAFVPRGRARVILVDEAHTFTDEAREALLPVLEKLASINVLVLTTTRPDFDEAFLCIRIRIICRYCGIFTARIEQQYSAYFLCSIYIQRHRTPTF